MNCQKVLIKYGGNAMINEDLKKEIAAKIKELQDHQIKVILVHGGGPFINLELKKAGIASEFFDGQRLTTAEALLHIEKTLKGEVNSSLVNIFNRAGLNAVGLSGKDGRSVLAKKRWHHVQNEFGESSRIDLGQVGEIKSVDTKLLQLLLDKNFTPIVTCIASDEEGNDYNINADVFAGKLAVALEVHDYIVLTDVDGLYADYPDPLSLVPQITLEKLPFYYQTIISGGMKPKIESCEAAVRAGVKRATILNGTKPEQISDYILKKIELGTTLRQ
jgi:acetylglutamate kinase